MARSWAVGLIQERSNSRVYMAHHISESAERERRNKIKVQKYFRAVFLFSVHFPSVKSVFITGRSYGTVTAFIVRGLITAPARTLRTLQALRFSVRSFGSRKQARRARAIEKGARRRKGNGSAVQFTIAGQYGD